ncbi:hypothetical protein L1S32_10165 [Methanogenium sp. S4BF]|uniref:hypothetical protein n=1 Tax=Methanogenium sp. S4BF TaxID=1789226 RepID=UPI00241808BB|nr:hypothetical protein [Methanogenium sp. S4BF]WFN34198.1 hypothetical protein L1S32_10165 [Methanogenium sp. S4BF]
MKKDIGAESPYSCDGVTIIPLYRSRKTTFPGGAAGEKEPLGVLIHSGTSLSIVSFTGSYAWWEGLTDEYPGLRAIKPVFPDTTS